MIHPGGSQNRDPLLVIDSRVWHPSERTRLFWINYALILDGKYLLAIDQVVSENLSIVDQVVGVKLGGMAPPKILSLLWVY